uniref:glucosamine 6-phosphate N-acetyltransferase-like n=1 Tax=Ciona intestinalis TaxID=7719 RepID=UPI0000524ACD|nr:glucosamine 6-phosphate N-acetyltransferase-like [Ciona intestinalis]|eukprot:XP_002129237.3 glucosamine 6-phosphate N-acetyltransferase-like [Ciona intestinalis]
MPSDKTSNFMFDAALLQDVNLTKYGISFKDDKQTPTNPEPGIVIRPLAADDFEKGYTDVLAQLTKVGEVDQAAFTARFEAMKKAGFYYPIVVEDTQVDNGKGGKIIGTGTLEIEQKFIHSCALRGRVEEVVVDSEYRGRQLGKLILGIITELSRSLKCYKTTLECKMDNIAFYEIFGYKEDPEKFMQLRFRD